MSRVCGAERDREPREQRLCWCAGLFCGPGGAGESRKFRVRFGVRGAVASSRDALKDLMGQRRLLSDVDYATEWLARLDGWVFRRTGRRAS